MEDECGDKYGRAICSREADSYISEELGKIY